MFSPWKAMITSKMHFTIDRILKLRKYGDDKNHWPSGPNSSAVMVPQLFEFRGTFQQILTTVSWTPWKSGNVYIYAWIREGNSHNDCTRFISHPITSKSAPPITTGTHVKEGAREEFSDACEVQELSSFFDIAWSTRTTLIRATGVYSTSGNKPS